MTYNPDLNSLFDEGIEDETDNMNEAIKPLLVGVKTLASDDDIDTNEKVELFDLATSLLRHGRKALHRHQPLSPAALLGGSSNRPAALPSGSDASGSNDMVLTGEDADKYRTLLLMFGGSSNVLLDNVLNVLGPLSRASGDELITNRLRIMSKIAAGTIKVLPDGQLEIEKKLSTAERNLSTEQAKTVRLEAELARASTPRRPAAPANPANDSEAALNELLEHARISGMGSFKALNVHVRVTALSEATLARVLDTTTP